MCSFDTGRCRVRNLVVVIVLLFLFAWPGNVAAVHKKKVSIEPLANPADWTDSFDPGALIAMMLERSIKSTGKYQVLKPPAQTPHQSPPSWETRDFDVSSAAVTQRHPAQVSIGGRVLTFKPKSDSSNAQVDIELVLIDAFTQSILGNKQFSSKASTGRVPFHVPEGALDFDGPVIQNSAMGKALAMSIKKALSFLETTLSRVSFQAVIISVDDDKQEVLVNAGKDNGIEVLEVFYVYSMELNFIDPVTQQNLGEKVARQGVIKIKSVFDKYSLAEITAGSDFKGGFVVRPGFGKSSPSGESRSWRELYGKSVNP